MNDGYVKGKDNNYISEVKQTDQNTKRIKNLLFS